MTILPRPSRILLALELPDPDALSDEVVRFLSPVTVVLLGWLKTPEQTPPEQAREELEDDGSRALESTARRLRAAGARVEVHHVFTPSLAASVDRIEREEACGAALLPAPSLALDHLLIPVRASTPVTGVAGLVSEIAGDRRVTVLQLVESGGAGDGDAPRIEPDWTGELEQALVDAGVDPDRVGRETEFTDQPADTVLERCREGPCGLVVLAGSGTLEERMSDDFAREILDEGQVPVLVVALSD